jgi:hypothetical protein
MTETSSRYLSLEERLNLILARITSKELLNNEGLGNEIGFHIFDYPAEREDTVRDYLATVLEPGLHKHPGKLRFRTVNLFQIVINLLEERGLLDKALALQQAKGNDALLKAVGPVLKEDKLASYLVNSLDVDNLDLVLLTGIGAAYPLVRLHTLLNGLHPLMKHTPLVVFYPGRYDGVSLRLFGLNTDSSDASAPYYRAFQLLK